MPSRDASGAVPRPADFKKTDEEAPEASSVSPRKAGRLRFLPSPLRLFAAGKGGGGSASASRPPASRSAALLLLALASAGLFALHRFGAGVAKRFEPDALRETFQSAGPVGGVALYVAAFCVGELLHLPGTLFVAAGVLVWGCAPGAAPRKRLPG